MNCKSRFSGNLSLENQGAISSFGRSGVMKGNASLGAYGTINIPGPIGYDTEDALTSVTLRTRSNSDTQQTTITTNGIKSSVSVEIETASSGDIINASGSVSTGSLTLTSTAGNIHGNSLGGPLPPISGIVGNILFDFNALPLFDAYRIDAKVVNISTGRGGASPEGVVGIGGNVYVSNTSSDINVTGINAGASLRFESVGTGKLQITGAMSLSGPAVIQAPNGSISFQQGSLLAGADTLISAASTVSMKDSRIAVVQGNLEIVAGSKVTLTASKLAAFGTENKGNVYFGITGQQDPSQLSIATSQKNIVVQGLVEWGTESDSKGNRKPVVTGLGTTNFITGANRSVVFDANKVNSFVLKDGSTVNATELISPIAFTEFGLDSTLKMLEDKTAFIWTENSDARAFRKHAQELCFENGSFYLFARKAQSVWLGSKLKLAVAAGSFLRICVSPAGVSVCNVADKTAGSVKTNLSGREICINPAQELFTQFIGGAKAVRQARAMGSGYQLADISIPYLLLSDKSMRDILNAKRYLKNHVFKTAAAIAMLSASRGKYAEKNEEAGK